MRYGGFRSRFFVLLETLGALETSVAVTAMLQSAFRTCPQCSAEPAHHFADMLVLTMITCNGRIADLLSSQFSQNIKRTLHTQITEIICAKKDSGRGHWTEKRQLIQCMTGKVVGLHLACCDVRCYKNILFSAYAIRVPGRDSVAHLPGMFHLSVCSILCHNRARQE